MDTRVTAYGAGLELAGRNTRSGAASARLVRRVRTGLHRLRRLVRDPEFWRPIRWCYWLGIKILIGVIILTAMQAVVYPFKF